MGKNVITADVGFSVNTEQQQKFGPPTGEKGSLEMIKFGLAGTSANVARAIMTLGHESRLFALTGKERNAEGYLLNFLLKESKIPHVKFPVLESSDFTIIPLDDQSDAKSRCLKNEMVQRRIKNVLKHVEEIEGGTWRIGTGVRGQHIELAKAFFNRHFGHRVLNPRAEIINPTVSFRELLKSTDFLIINSTEYKAFQLTSPSELHKFLYKKGQTLVIVTESKHGGMFSLKGHPVERFNACTDYLLDEQPVFENAAGDCFEGGFISKLGDFGKSIATATIDDVRQAILFATHVAGKKITTPDAICPSKIDLIHYKEN